MNPPFSVVAACREALRRRRLPASRLGACAAARGRAPRRDHRRTMSDPTSPAGATASCGCRNGGRVVFSAAIAGQAYARHGTTMETRLTVIDRVPAEDPRRFPPSPGMAADCRRAARPGDPRWCRRARPPSAPAPPRPRVSIRHGSRRSRGPRRIAPHRRFRVRRATSRAPSNSPTRPRDWAPAERGRLTAALYEGYALQSIAHRRARSRIRPSSCSRPRWPSVAPPRPSYRPHLPPRLVEGGLLSDAQLESVDLCRRSACRPSRRVLHRRRDLRRRRRRARRRATGAVRFRRGWFLGDGTGAGKGRQVAGDHSRQLAARAAAARVWISKSDKLIEDAAARLVGARQASAPIIVPLVALPPGHADPPRRRHPVHDLRDAAHAGRTRAKSSPRPADRRLARPRISTASSCSTKRMPWPNAAGDKGERGDKTPSQQGRAGLRLQHALPDARILYVSATGATTVHNLAYAAAARPLGQRRFSVRDPRRVRRRDRGAAASPRWRCWRAI